MSNVVKEFKDIYKRVVENQNLSEHLNELH